MRTITVRPRRRGWTSVARTLLLLLIVLVGLFAAPPPSADAAGDERRWPVSGPVVRAFDPPDQPWLSGHRGIDIAAPAGSPVLAAADGTVSWVGSIAGVPSLSITHAGGVRTTYQPVTARVATGASVAAGTVVGVLRAGHAATDCLHLGLLRGDAYLDPLAWLGGQATAGPIRLLPDGAAVPPDTSVLLTPTDGWPVSGPITSPYGWRTDPITGARSFHDGTDIGAPCGTPVVATMPGTVVTVATDDILGHYVVVQHADGVRTIYAHLSTQMVGAGQAIRVGQVLGLVGTTGRSTGCHLHFGATRDGVSFDSGTLLP